MCPDGWCDTEMTLMGEGSDGAAHVQWWWCRPPDGCGRMDEVTGEPETVDVQPDLFGGDG